jgi:hypothetical protein
METSDLCSNGSPQSLDSVCRGTAPSQYCEEAANRLCAHWFVLQCAGPGEHNCTEVDHCQTGLTPATPDGPPISSPVVINLGPGEYRLTGADDPVLFDIAATGHPLRIGWTAADADEAFLWYDRNHDGIVNDGSELFGTATVLANGKKATNGFEALAVFDSDGNGMIDRNDAVWPKLLLWQDKNHDGVSQSDEISAISASAVRSIVLQYHLTGRRDRWGNKFSHESSVVIERGVGSVLRPVYDIFFVVVP